jgi:ribose-phosphate pyrophosphokinase
VNWRFENNEEMVSLYFLVHHIRAVLKKKEIILKLPYIPNARMDRTSGKDEVFTLKYFCQFINQLGFERVIVRDPHSNVALGLLDRVETEDLKPMLTALVKTLLTAASDRLYFPDEGSQKRYGDWFGIKKLFGIKKREWETGKILGLEVLGEVPEGPFRVLMIDDICSYGGTFFRGAKQLKALGAENIWLFVTHCENTILKGELFSSGLIEKVFTTESIYTETHPQIEVLGGKTHEDNATVAV